MKELLKKLKIKKLFQDDDSRFLLACGLKFCGIFLFTAAFVYYSMWIIVSMNSVYFESSKLGFGTEMRDLFLTNAFSFIYHYIPEMLLFGVFLFFCGMFVGKVLLRPFEVIGNYCKERSENESTEYNPDLFSDYKLLTRFSEYFFSFIETSLKERVLTKQTVPSQFAKVHAPPFERVFFFHFFLIVLILAVFVGFFVAYLALDVHEQIINLSFQFINDSQKGLSYFLDQQRSIYVQIVIASSLIVAVGYLGLSFHLYGKISGAIFGFFATMRSFIKGNYKARVHLIGYAHIRPYGRFMNKFLDHVERQCSIDNNKKN